jgi:hypothetical protein
MTKKQIIKAIERGIKRLKKGWTTGTCAFNSEGHSCDPNSKNAVRWCAVGALGFKSCDGVDDAVLELQKTVKTVSRGKNNVLWIWNDRQKSGEKVIALFEKTIKRLKASP